MTNAEALKQINSLSNEQIRCLTPRQFEAIVKAYGSMKKDIAFKVKKCTSTFMCGNCGRMVFKGYNFCPKCGRETEW